MPYEPWMFVAMEEEGYTDTKEGQINRVAKYLAQGTGNEIGEQEFRRACAACGVKPSSFTQNDLNAIQKKLDQM
jgi:hypothetical protein